MAKRKEINLPEIPTQQEVQSFLNTFNKGTKTGYRNYVIFLAMAKSGMRISEVLNMRYDDIKEIQILDTDKAYYYRLSAKLSKNRRAADIPIHRELYQHILNLSKLYKHKQCGYIFTSVSKRDYKNRLLPVKSSYIRKIAKDHSDKAGISPAIHPHSLRHMYGTTIYEQTGDLLLVQSALRHANLESTKVYTHVRPDAVRRASELIDL